MGFDHVRQCMLALLCSGSEVVEAKGTMSMFDTRYSGRKAREIKT